MRRLVDTRVDADILSMSLCIGDKLAVSARFGLRLSSAAIDGTTCGPHP